MNTGFPSRHLSAGDHAPIFGCPDSEGGRFDLYCNVTGKPLIMIFSGETSLSAPMFSGLDLSAFRNPRAQVVTLVSGDQHFAKAAKSTTDWPHLIVADVGGEVTKGYEQFFGVKTPAVFVLDANQRLVDVAELDMIEDALSTWINEKVRQAIFDGAKTKISRVAPVLLIPRALEPEDCDWLIDLWGKNKRVQGQVGLGENAGKRDAVDLHFKRREDFIIQDGALEAKVMDRLLPRILPEISKIYHFSPSKLEAFRVGCYKAQNSGFFSVHRDNTNPSSKDRKFAVTVNLNPDEYKGGDLRFPEYGPEVYRPDKGAAIVFSCSMLHEVIPVVKGCRFALLTFM
jgi:predicted 2-oxoglutarate/Fe(II)-dependent dioxygenase YbiX